MKPPEHEEAHPSDYETLADVVARPPRPKTSRGIQDLN